MKIAIFASAFHPHVGGVEELTRQLALELQRQGHRAIIVTNRWPRYLPEFELIDGLDVHRLPLRAPQAGLKSEITYRLTHRMVERRISALIRSFQPDVIHVQCVSSGARYAMDISRKTGIPIVVTLQGELTMDATQLYQRSTWAQQTLRTVMEEADAMTACSRQTLMEAEVWLGRPFGQRGTVIYNGISPEDIDVAIPYAHPRPYILAIGRHVHQKGFDLLLQAVASLISDATFNHDLLLAGDGADHQKLRALAAELKLGDRIIFTGRVDHMMAMRLFAGCSFFVLPSRHEPFGIVNLEAMAAGKAVIATRVGGVPEIVEHNVNGLLLPSEDACALATALRFVASESGLRERLGAEGRKTASRFSWSAISNQYQAIYRRVASTSPAAGSA